MEHLKIHDTVRVDRSKVAAYWSTERFTSLYQIFRRPLKLPKSVLHNINSVEKIQNTFKIKGFQFGNWSSNEDRFNYLATVYICFYDLNKILKFKGANLGLDQTLSISFGARGSGGATAHFEPQLYVINMTRYKRADVMKKHYRMFATTEQLKLFDNKAYRFLNTGGVGALAHEYGHFLDYYFGQFVDTSTQSVSLSGGRFSIGNRIAWTNKQPIRLAMENLLMAAIWKNEAKGIHSPFFIRMKKATKKQYFFRRNEVFARIFEAYVSHKLSGMGIYNDFLSQRKYPIAVYPKANEIKALALYMDKLLVQFRKNVK